MHEFQLQHSGLGTIQHSGNESIFPKGKTFSFEREPHAFVTNTRYYIAEYVSVVCIDAGKQINFNSALHSPFRVLYWSLSSRKYIYNVKFRCEPVTNGGISAEKYKPPVFGINFFPISVGNVSKNNEENPRNAQMRFNDNKCVTLKKHYTVKSCDNFD